MAVENEKRDDALNRMSRIEGQVKGVRKMVEDGKYCVDVLTQISAIHEALRSVGKIVMRDHLERCVTDALRAGDDARAERTYSELMDIIYKYAK